MRRTYELAIHSNLSPNLKKYREFANILLKIRKRRTRETSESPKSNIKFSEFGNNLPQMRRICEPANHQNLTENATNSGTISHQCANGLTPEIPIH